MTTATQARDIILYALATTRHAHVAAAAPAGGAAAEITFTDGDTAVVTVVMTGEGEAAQT